MPDISADVLQVLRHPRFGTLPWDADQVPPHYGGYSILNIPTSVAQALGAPPVGVAPPLVPALRAAWGEGIRRVVLLVVDGLGWSLFQAAREGHPAPPRPPSPPFGPGARPRSTASPATKCGSRTTG